MCKLQEIFKGVGGKEIVFGGLQNVSRQRLILEGEITSIPNSREMTGYVEFFS